MAVPSRTSLPVSYQYMKIGIIGAGAIGGWLAGRLARAGHKVSMLARGQTLTAIRRSGLILRDAEREEAHRLDASDDARDLGAQELLLLAVKAHSLPEVAAAAGVLIGPETLIVPTMNGVPWWFLGPDAPLRSIDPDGSIARAFPAAHIIGCVVHASCSCPSPGVTVLKAADRLILGEPGGDDTARLRALVSVMSDAGVPAVQSDRIRTDIWYKLWGNMTLNPISALTLATTDRILDDELAREFAARIMEEARTIGARCGCAIEQTTVERMALTRQLGSFRTSTLQDLEAGRSIELDALLGAPREIGARLGIPTPNMDALYGLTRLLGVSRKVYASR